MGRSRFVKILWRRGGQRCSFTGPGVTHRSPGSFLPMTASATRRRSNRAISRSKRANISSLNRLHADLRKAGG
jgi:hypothetical protein